MMKSCGLSLRLFSVAMGTDDKDTRCNLHPKCRGDARMRATRFLLLVMGWVILLAAGCKKNAVDTLAFKSALNSYYAQQQDCLFSVPVKFPAQADTSNDEQTKTYDALTDAGLLTRTSAEKK